MKIYNPLTGSTSVVLEKEIQCSFLIENYKKQLGVDVRRYFEGLETVRIYKCLDTGFRFYYPLDTAGDGDFYESLQKHSWYYMDWKWEHKVASKIIGPMDKVLEIGCARGGFLNKIQQKGTKCVGLELNERAARYGQSRGLKILTQSIQDHARENPEKYDVVCSFQVLEHVAKIKEFIQASIDAAKQGGKVIVSVPNNDSLIFRCNFDPLLNMPPHHMGLWNMNSLIKIQQIFNLQIDAIYLEPLQAYHIGYSQSLVEKRLSQKLRDKYGFLASFMKKIGDWFIKFSLEEVRKYINGHSIIAIYIKV